MIGLRLSEAVKPDLTTYLNDRHLTDTMIMLIRKKGSLNKQLPKDTLELEIFLPSDDMPKEENVNYQVTNIEKPYNDLNEHIQNNITIDVDGEAIYDRLMHRQKTYIR